MFESKHRFRVQSVKVFEVVVRGKHCIEEARDEAEGFVRELTDTGSIGTDLTRVDLREPSEKTGARGQYVEEILYEKNTSWLNSGSEVLQYDTDLEEQEKEELGEEYEGGEDADHRVFPRKS